MDEEASGLPARARAPLMRNGRRRWSLRVFARASRLGAGGSMVRRGLRPSALVTVGPDPPLALCSGRASTVNVRSSRFRFHVLLMSSGFRLCRLSSGRASGRFAWHAWAGAGDAARAAGLAPPLEFRGGLVTRRLCHAASWSRDVLVTRHLGCAGSSCPTSCCGRCCSPPLT